MLKNNVSKKTLILYYISIVLTRTEALINPTVVSYIVESFELRDSTYLLRALSFAVVSNLILLLGLSGKRLYYSKIIAEFRYNFKAKIFKSFLTSERIQKNDLLSAIEKDSLQIEDNYIEPTVIIISSIGFTLVSIIYALYKDLRLGLLFIVFYSLPALMSNFGSKKLNSYSEKLAASNKDFLNCLEDLSLGSKVIKSYDKGDFFTKIYLKFLNKDLDQYRDYEKCRVKNSLVINSVDIVSSIIPLILGGFLAFKGNLDSSRFIAIYLVSYNIGYQFQELAYYVNTRSSSKYLLDNYGFINSKPDKEKEEKADPGPIFPIEIKNLSFSYEDKKIFDNFNLTINENDKLAIIGESGSGKSTLLNLIFGNLEPSSGEILFNSKKLSKDEIRTFTSYISQESYVFNMGFLQNISLSDDFDGKFSPLIARLRLSHLLGKK